MYLWRSKKEGLAYNWVLIIVQNNYFIIDNIENILLSYSNIKLNIIYEQALYDLFIWNHSVHDWPV